MPGAHPDPTPRGYPASQRGLNGHTAVARTTPRRPRMRHPYPCSGKGVRRYTAPVGASVTLVTPAVAVEPGQSVSITVKIRNTGSVVDEFALDVLGDAAAWAAVEPPTVAQPVPGVPRPRRRPSSGRPAPPPRLWARPVWAPCPLPRGPGRVRGGGRGLVPPARSWTPTPSSSRARRGARAPGRTTSPSTTAATAASPQRSRRPTPTSSSSSSTSSRRPWWWSPAWRASPRSRSCPPRVLARAAQDTALPAVHQARGRPAHHPRRDAPPGVGAAALVPQGAAARPARDRGARPVLAVHAQAVHRDGRVRGRRLAPREPQGGGQRGARQRRPADDGRRARRGGLAHAGRPHAHAAAGRDAPALGRADAHPGPGRDDPGPGHADRRLALEGGAHGDLQGHAVPDRLPVLQPQRPGGRDRRAPQQRPADVPAARELPRLRRALRDADRHRGGRHAQPVARLRGRGERDPAVLYSGYLRP